MSDKKPPRYKLDDIVTDDAAERLKKQIEAGVSENERLIKRIKTMEKELQEVTAQTAEVGKLRKQITSQAELIKVIEAEKTRLEQETQQINQTINTSFTAEEFSQHLHRTIEVFNETQSHNQHADYMISSMDVDLKARIYTEKTGRLLFSGPDISRSGSEGLSTIKITIKAVPKQG